MKQLSFMLLSVALLFAIGCKPTKTTASKSKIQFVEKKTYTEVLEIAKIAGKPILIDFYTTWCAPCKWLEKDVFELPQVYEYYNENIISFKVNAEDFDNVALAEQYGVKAYPTLVFLTQNGVVVRKHEGTTTGTNFIQWGKEVVQANKKG